MTSLVSILIIYAVGVLIGLGLVSFFDRRGSRHFRNWDDSADIASASLVSILWPLWVIAVVVFGLLEVFNYLFKKFWNIILPDKSK